MNAILLSCLITYLNGSAQTQQTIDLSREQVSKKVGSFEVTTFVDAKDLAWIAIDANGVKTEISGTETSGITASVSLKEEVIGVVCSKANSDI